MKCNVRTAVGGRLLLVLVLGVTLLAVSVQGVPYRKRDVCIIGGGVAGMGAAVMLKDRGYKDVLVLESAPEIGGSCDTYRFKDSKGHNRAVDAGVIVFPNTSYANAQGCGPWSLDSEAFIRRFVRPEQDQLTPQPFVSSTPNFLADFSRGVTYGKAPSPSAQSPSPEFLAEFEKLRDLMRTKYAWTDGAFYPDSIPEELLKPFSEWIVANNFTALTEYLAGRTSSCGYGSMGEVTALYPVINSCCTHMLFGVPNPHAWFYLPNGCMQIFDGMRDYLGRENIRTGATVHRVYRSHGGPVVLLGHQEADQPRPRSGSSADEDEDDGEGRHHQFVEVCNDLIVSIPPTLSNLGFLAPLTEEEAALFGHVRVRSYFQGVANVTVTGALAALDTPWNLVNIDPSQPLAAPPSPLIYALDRYEGGAVGARGGPTAFTGFSDTPLTHAELTAVVEKGLAGLPREQVERATLVQCKMHQFNPHFTPEALAWKPHGPYTLLERMQGRRHTYYVGAIRSFGNAVTIWNSLLGFMDRYFPAILGSEKDGAHRSGLKCMQDVCLA